MERKIEKTKTKTEQAEIMGIKIPTNDYWGDYSSKTCGGVGGASLSNCTKDDIEISKGEKFHTKVKRLE